jgi:hypothetical protein
MVTEEKFKAPVAIFYSYSHKDETYREELEKHLTTLRLSGLISDWHDRKILAGDEWDKKISEYSEKSYVIMLLISSDFIASKYCYDIEAARALERYNKGEALLIPIILRPVKWELTPFGKIQALPKNAQPVTQWADKDSAYLNICEGILALLTSVKSEQKDSTPENKNDNQEIKPLFTPVEHITSEKVLDAALPEHVTVGKTIALVVMIRGKDSEGLKKILKVNTQYGVGEEDVISTGTFPLEFATDEAGKPLPLELNIKIESPDFEQTTQAKSIRILPDGDSEPRIFLLTPKTTGDLIVNLELYSGDNFVSGSFLRTKSSQTAPQDVSTNLVTVPINPKHSVDFDIQTTDGPSSDWNSPPPPSKVEETEKNQPSRKLSPGMIAAFSIFFVLAGSIFIIPNLLSSRASNNSASAISSLRTIQAAQTAYLSINDSKNYGTLEQLKNADLIDQTLASGEKSGYQFTVTTSTLNNKPVFEVTAKPSSPEAGDRSFYTNEQGEIYYSKGNILGLRANPGIPLN